MPQISRPGCHSSFLPLTIGNHWFCCSENCWRVSSAPFYPQRSGDHLLRVSLPLSAAARPVELERDCLSLELWRAERIAEFLGCLKATHRVPKSQKRGSMSVANVEKIVRERYKQGAYAPVEALCCPTDYDPKLLEVIPAEVLERDYGCGDPSRHLRPGETVLDLGSGSGKICFIASQVVGPEGWVIGVDMTPEMLEVARKNAPLVAKEIGFANVEFRRGRIQDLSLDLDLLEQRLAADPVMDVESLLAIEQKTDELRETKPLVENDSVDVVVSNCVLNLVSNGHKRQLFSEIHRVLRRGGRAVISDIVSDEDVPLDMQEDPELWSGCISGALTESGFLEAFEDAGFYGIQILERTPAPWKTVNGIEFRSVTVEAFKGKEGVCLERNQAVVYKGPFKEIVDDDGHRYRRGSRYAVCDKTFQLYKKKPYRDFFEFVEPREEISLEEATLFDCAGTRLRHPRETKGQDFNLTTGATEACCEPGDCC